MQSLDVHDVYVFVIVCILSFAISTFANFTSFSNSHDHLKYQIYFHHFEMLFVKKPLLHVLSYWTFLILWFIFSSSNDVKYTRPCITDEG